MEDLLIWYTKSYTDSSPRGKIHLYNNEQEETLCDKQIMQNGMWMIAYGHAYQATCKACASKYKMMLGAVIEGYNMGADEANQTVESIISMKE